MDRLDTIALFVRVAELGSFSRAATAAGVSRAAASRAVSSLESRLGVRLLNRTTRSLSLTEAGTRYLERARGGLAALDAAAEEAGQLQSRPRGHLRVNGPLSLGWRHLAPVFAEYRCRFPEVTLDLTLMDRRVDLVEEGYDAVIRVGTLADSSLIARRLGQVRFSVSASPAYLDRAGWPGHPRDLLNHECLGYAYAVQASWSFEKDSAREQVRVPSAFSTNNGDAVAAAAAAGAGIARLPQFIAEDWLRDGRLVEVLPEWRASPVEINLLYAPQPTVPTKLRSLIDLLVERFRDLEL